MHRLPYDLRPPNEHGIVREYYTNEENARIIFNEFVIGQSATFKGLQMTETRIQEVGEAIVLYMIKLDRATNFQKSNDGRSRRKTRKPDDVIGVFVDQKAFRFKKDIRDGVPVTTIWRVQ